MTGERIECSIGCGNSYAAPAVSMPLGWTHFAHRARGLNANHPTEEIPEMYVCPDCFAGAESMADWLRGYLDARMEAREAPRKADMARGAWAFQRQQNGEVPQATPSKRQPWRKCLGCERVYSPEAFLALPVDEVGHRRCSVCRSMRERRGRLNGWGSLWPEQSEGGGRETQSDVDIITQRFRVVAAGQANPELWKACSTCGRVYWHTEYQTLALAEGTQRICTKCGAYTAWVWCRRQ